MNIYKYRDFSNPTELDFNRLAALIHQQVVWCARPDTLNDPEEFLWSCDYSVTDATLGLLIEVLIKARGRTRADAERVAASAIEIGNLEEICKPVISGMMEQCRCQIGLSCFGTTPNNETLWKRYGGNGAGVCIEFLVPNDLLGRQLHHVQYSDKKRGHIDRLFLAFIDSAHIKEVYDLALLTKPSSWADEEEIRYVSRTPSIAVAIDRATVPRVFMGKTLSADARARIARLAAPVPLVEIRASLMTRFGQLRK